MNLHRANHRWLLIGSIMAAVIAVLLLVAATFAPTTEGLILHAVGHQATANVGNRNEASILVSAYNAAGPIRGIGGGSFTVVTTAAPVESHPITKAAVSEIASGVYKISVAPERPQHTWAAGVYVFGITLTSANGSGVVLSELEIVP